MSVADDFDRFTVGPPFYTPINGQTAQSGQAWISGGGNFGSATVGPWPLSEVNDNGAPVTGLQVELSGNFAILDAGVPLSSLTTRLAGTGAWGGITLRGPYRPADTGFNTYGPGLSLLTLSGSYGFLVYDVNGSLIQLQFFSVWDYGLPDMSDGRFRTITVAYDDANATASFTVDGQPGPSMVLTPAAVAAIEGMTWCGYWAYSSPGRVGWWVDWLTADVPGGPAPAAAPVRIRLYPRTDLRAGASLRVAGSGYR